MLFEGQLYITYTLYKILHIYIYVCVQVYIYSYIYNPIHIKSYTYMCITWFLHVCVYIDTYDTYVHIHIYARILVVSNLR